MSVSMDLFSDLNSNKIYNLIHDKDWNNFSKSIHYILASCSKRLIVCHKFANKNTEKNALLTIYVYRLENHIASFECVYIYICLWFSRMGL